ncbi:unnamed protein product [Coregonus sp. 'balchen']|nr:unnamed protein product [Coregonus sp. 'balchen']
MITDSGLETSCDATEDGSQCHGALRETVYLQLVTNDMGYDELKSPVSSPQLSSECLSHGEIRVSCSSEGNGPQYSRTLDGHTVRDTEASSDNETNTITLKKGLSGDLTCTIRNNISSVAVSKRISHCPGVLLSVLLQSVSSECYSRVLVQSVTSECYSRVLVQSVTSECYFRVLLQSVSSECYFRVLVKSVTPECYSRVLVQSVSSAG